MRLGKGVRGEDRERHARQGRRFYGDLLWLGYQLASRCYGAWAMLAYLDFSLSAEVAATPAERVLFRQLHYRQTYLAALPLAFLGRPQTRWIWPTISDLWRRGVFRPEPYDRAADMLGQYGYAVRNRRRVDRDRKRRMRREALGEGAEGAAAMRRWQEGLDRPDDDLPLLRGRSCPGCGHPLALVRSLGAREAGRVAAEFRCDGCDEVKEYLVDTAAFPGR
jgi:hypothetical protein